MIRQDILIQGFLAGGDIRILAISAGNIVQQAQDMHGLSRVCTAAFGRQAMATAMMAVQLKREGESLTTLINSDGPIGSMVCTGNYGAHIKGYVSNPGVELPPNIMGKLDVSGVVGKKGRLTVVKDLSLKEPYSGSVELVSGEIAEDFAQYFLTSEQQPSLVYLGVRVRPDTGKVLSAGGLIAQPMPGRSGSQVENAISMLEQRAAGIGTLAERLELAPLGDVLYGLFHDMQLDALSETTPLLQCDCSRERTECALLAVGESEILDMIEKDNGAELTCQFCHAHYDFTTAQLRALLAEGKQESVRGENAAIDE